MPNHADSGGIPSAKNSRFDGLAIGNRKLAALATSAQAKTYGSGSASVRASATSTAGRQHDDRRVVRKERGGRDPGAVHEREQSRARVARGAHGAARDPVENALDAGELRQRHHPDQEQIDVRAARERRAGGRRADRLREHEHDGTAGRPPRFVDAPRPEDHPEQRQPGDEGA